MKSIGQKIILSVFVVFLFGCGVEHMIKKQRNTIPPFKGKNIQETLVGNYFKKELVGNNAVAVVSFACSHCVEATINLKEYKKEGLIEEVYIIGSHHELVDSFKQDFIQKVGGGIPEVSDYNFLELVESMVKTYGDFSVPIVLFTKDNLIDEVFVSEIPSVKAFKKYKTK